MLGLLPLLVGPDSGWLINTKLFFLHYAHKRQQKNNAHALKGLMIFSLQMLLQRLHRAERRRSSCIPSCLSSGEHPLQQITQWTITVLVRLWRNEGSALYMCPLGLLLITDLLPHLAIGSWSEASSGSAEQIFGWRFQHEARHGGDAQNNVGLAFSLCYARNANCISNGSLTIPAVVVAEGESRGAGFWPAS